MAINGQTVEDAIEALQNLVGHDLVLTDYEINAVTPDGNTIKLFYDVKKDERFK